MKRKLLYLVQAVLLLLLLIMITTTSASDDSNVQKDDYIQFKEEFRGTELIQNTGEKLKFDTGSIYQVASMSNPDKTMQIKPKLTRIWDDWEGTRTITDTFFQEHFDIIRVECKAALDSVDQNYMDTVFKELEKKCPTDYIQMKIGDNKIQNDLHDRFQEFLKKNNLYEGYKEFRKKNEELSLSLLNDDPKAVAFAVGLIASHTSEADKNKADSKTETDKTKTDQNEVYQNETDQNKAEQKEPDKTEADQKEAQKEAEQKEAERKEPDKTEAQKEARKEAKRKEAERKEAERNEADTKKADEKKAEKEKSQSSGKYCMIATLVFGIITIVILVTIMFSEEPEEAIDPNAPADSW